jgi:hypothetical protein
MAGWRWLFIIDGVISLPIALAGFFIFPGLPSSAKPWWLTPAEHKLARTRMVNAGVAPSKKLSWTVIRRTFTRWEFYLGVLCYTFFLSSSYPHGQMGIWLKDLAAKHKGAYTIPQINTIPTGAQGVSVFAALLATSLCMVYPLWSILSIVQTIYIVANISLLVWNIPKGWHCEYLQHQFSAAFCELGRTVYPPRNHNAYVLLNSKLIDADKITVACYYLLGVSAAITPILMPFINMALRDDAEARAVTVGAMLTAGWAVFSFYPITVFPIVQGPRWTRGYSVNIAFICGCWVTFLIMQYLYKKSEKKRADRMIRDITKDEEDITAIEQKNESEVREYAAERK